jgi:hypothetical protein
LGQQTEPRRVIITQLDDFLALLRKRPEFDRFVADVLSIRYRLPTLEPWLYTRPQWIIDNHGQWNDLLTVCEYFIRNPRPNLYIRELPIAVHTKFVEQNEGTLRYFLEALLPDETIESETSDFCQRFGLKSSPALLRLRLLDEQFKSRYDLCLDDLSLPIEQAAYLLSNDLQPRCVLIVENLMNFLTLPPLDDTVALFGRGFAVHLLRKVPWLAQCDVIYWGDIDGHGFEILSDLRGLFPRTRSVLMDRQTLADNEYYLDHNAPPCAARFEYLTQAEAELAQHVVTNTLRLEQEHIPYTYALPHLCYSHQKADLPSIQRTSGKVVKDLT